MRERVLHLLAIVCFAAIFYVNSFGNFFVWNDWTLIIENFLVKDWWNLREVFFTAFWKPLVGEPGQIYRPVVLLGFMADFSLWGFRAWGYHLTNISLHVLNSILLYFLMKKYVSPTTALMGSILFAAHPIHTEAVTYISGRAELLMAFFLLGGTLLFLKSAKEGSILLYIGSLPLFFLSMSAKETAGIFPLILLAADLTAHPASNRRDIVRRLARQGGPLAVLGLYFLLRTFWVGFAPPAVAAARPDFFSHLLSVLQAILLYIGLLAFPLDLHFLHHLDPSPALNGQVILSLFLLLIAGWGVRRNIRSGQAGVAFAILWLLIGLLPLVYWTGLHTPLLEGWIYFASGGFFLLAAIGFDRLRGLLPSQTHFWVAVLVAVLLGAATLRRNGDWKDEVQISRHTLESSPEDPIALRLLGNAQFRRARIPEAEQLYQKALLLAPEDPRLHESLARLYDFHGKDPEVSRHYQHMLRLTPKDPYPYWRLGRYHLRKKEFGRAEKYLGEAVRLFPYSSEIRNDLATAYYLQGKLEAARGELEAALKISPHSPVLKTNLERLDPKEGSPSLTLPSQ